jgi:transposase
MPQPALKVKPHLTHEEVGQRYRKCKNPIEKSRWQLIWLMTNPKKEILVTEAAEIVGFCSNWARILVHRYNSEGSEKFIDKRKNNKGKKAFLNKKLQKELRNTLINKRPPDGGLWTGPKVAAWIEKKTKKHITAVGAWKWIGKLGFTLQVPRPKNIQAANEKEKKEFKKNWILNS